MLPCSDHGAGSISVLDDGCDPWDWPSALLFDVAALPVAAPEFIFRVTVLASIFSSPCMLESAVRGVISLTGVFLRVLGTFALLAVADCLFRSHLLGAVGDTAEGISNFSLRKNTYM